jgi:hypothetical protein
MASYTSVYYHWGAQDPDTIGIAFLLTNGDEKDEDHLPGTLQDHDNWKKALVELNFDIRRDHNVQKDRMKQFLEAVSKVQLQPDCKFVVFVFSGHGAEGILYSCDGERIILDQYLPHFFEGELSKINKLFFFDACREGSGGRYLTLDEALFENKPKESMGGYLVFCSAPINAEVDDVPTGSPFSTIVPNLIAENLSLADVVAKTREKLQDPPLLDCLSGGLAAASVNLWKLANPRGL